MSLSPTRRQDTKHPKHVSATKSTDASQSPPLKMTSEIKSNSNEKRSDEEPMTVNQVRRGVPCVPDTIHTRL